MPFFRGLILIVAVWLAFTLARQLYRSHQRKQVARQNTAKQRLSATIVPCAQCGVHIPKDEAITANGRYFCSDEHSDIKS